MGNIYIDLRDDVKRRLDAWVFRKILPLVSWEAHTRNVMFVRDVRKSRNVSKFVRSKKYMLELPFRGWIYPDQYEKLNDQVRKHFRRWSSIGNYDLQVSYFFVPKVKPYIVTHSLVKDRETESLISYYEYELNHLGRVFYKNDAGYNRWKHRQIIAERKISKAEINRFIKNERDDIIINPVKIY